MLAARNLADQTGRFVERRKTASRAVHRTLPPDLLGLDAIGLQVHDFDHLGEVVFY